MSSPTFSRIASVFMIVAFAIGAFYIVSFVRVYPQYWFAAVLFLIIAVVSIVRRIAVLRGTLPADRAPTDRVAPERDPLDGDAGDRG